MLNDTQQQLFRIMSTVKAIPKFKAIKLFSDVVEYTKSGLQCNEHELDKQIAVVNRFINPFHLEIMEGMDEVTYDRTLVLVNTADNSITQKAKFYDKKITQLFSKIVQACVMSELGKVSEIMCINLNSLLDMSKTAAQESLMKLIKEKWLASKDGEIYLTTRSILELEPIIKKTCPDHAKLCPLCRKFLIQGSICASCESKIHFGCMERYLNRITDPAKKVCPLCKKPWEEYSSQDTSDGSSAGSDVDDGPRPSQAKKCRQK